MLFWSGWDRSGREGLTATTRGWKQQMNFYFGKFLQGTFVVSAGTLSPDYANPRPVSRGLPDSDRSLKYSPEKCLKGVPWIEDFVGDHPRELDAAWSIPSCSLPGSRT